MHTCPVAADANLSSESKMFEQTSLSHAKEWKLVINFTIPNFFKILPWRKMREEGGKSGGKGEEEKAEENEWKGVRAKEWKASFWLLC